MDKWKKWNGILRNLTLLSQLGLSLVVPVLMCLWVCYLLTVHLHWGAWIYIPGFILGLGASFMTAYKVYIQVTEREKRNSRADRTGFNRHR